MASKLEWVRIFVSIVTRAIRRLRHYAWFIRVRAKNEAFDLLIGLFNLYVRVRAGLRSSGVIYIVGDSHSRSFRYRYPIIVDHFGGSTAHNLISDKSVTNSREKLSKVVDRVNWSRDCLVLVFGEIDCRQHVYRSIESQDPNGDVHSIVDSTIERYFSAVREINDASRKLMVCGVPPAADGVDEKTTPVYGSLDKRQEITRLFNETLERESSKLGVGFLDVYSLVTDDNGATAGKFRHDGVHLSRELSKATMGTIRRYWQS